MLESDSAKLFLRYNLQYFALYCPVTTSRNCKSLGNPRSTPFAHLNDLTKIWARSRAPAGSPHHHESRVPKTQLFAVFSLSHVGVHGIL